MRGGVDGRWLVDGTIQVVISRHKLRYSRMRSNNGSELGDAWTRHHNNPSRITGTMCRCSPNSAFTNRLDFHDDEAFHLSMVWFGLLLSSSYRYQGQRHGFREGEPPGSKANMVTSLMSISLVPVYLRYTKVADTTAYCHCLGDCSLAGVECVSTYGRR